MTHSAVKRQLHLPHRRHAAPLEQELMPGDVALARRGERLKTLLGSCVAVILTDPHRTVGVMCHIVHSSRPNSANLHNTAFGSCAMDDMFHRLRRVGLAPTLCQAYAFGGGDMFPHLGLQQTVGERNARWVTDFLAEHNIELLTHSLGGAQYRKIAWTVGPEEPELVLTPVDMEL
jgi:chemotaxis protein CheD